MELVERVQRMKRNLDEADDPSLPFYRRKKYFIVIIIVCLSIVLVLGVIAVAVSFPHHKSISMPMSEPRVIAPLQWEGVCPKTTDKCPSSFQDPPPVILISLDGFHPSFMDSALTPTIKNIARCGTHAPYMASVFPTKTFPNHVSQVTGVYPTYHGIIDNNMYDPVRRKIFKVGQPESLNPSWWLMEPIWVTAQKQGKKSGCFFWPGSEVEINGTYPTYYKKYSSKTSFHSRVDQILAWLDLPSSSRPNLLTLYVNQPDYALHHSGIKSKQTKDALIKVDNMIERLLSGLQQRKLINCVNVIIMSDHGMSDTSCRNVIDIQKFINVNDTFNIAGPFGRLRPKGKRDATIVNEIVSKLRCQSPHMRVYPKEQLPVRYHYADNPRIEPIFLDLDVGWTVVSKDVTKSDDSICTGGAHGYDNMFPDMRAIFLAHGPSFKKNFTSQPFINIEVYEMLAELLGITPNPNNGTRGSLHYIMTSPKILNSQKEPNPPVFAEVPDDDTMFNDRLTASTCNCPESQKQKKVTNHEVIKNTHLPFGIPFSADENNSLNLLYNEDYVTAFSLKYQIPLWSAFTVKEQIKYNNVDEICWNGDVRIPENSSPKCSDFAKITEANKFILQRPLYPPGFSSSASNREDAMLITNSVLKSFNHTHVLENYFNSMLTKWTSNIGDLNIITGPAFDIFGVGVKPEQMEFMQYYEKNGPLLIPTHIFAVVTWCTTKKSPLISCDPSKLQTQGFLLPNVPYPENCEAPAAVISKNVARVVDIEKLTGLSFYRGLPIYEAIRLRTMLPILLIE